MPSDVSSIIPAALPAKITDDKSTATPTAPVKALNAPVKALTAPVKAPVIALNKLVPSPPTPIPPPKPPSDVFDRILLKYSRNFESVITRLLISTQTASTISSPKPLKKHFTVIAKITYWLYKPVPF